MISSIMFLDGTYSVDIFHFLRYFLDILSNVTRQAFLLCIIPTVIFRSSMC